MTNHLSWETLNDLVDGVLTPAAGAAAESHARECQECGTALAELRMTVAEARALPGSVSPPDELWSDVRATIEAGKVAHLPSGVQTAHARGWWVTPGRLAAAAVVLVAATASLTSIVMRPGPAPVVAVVEAQPATVSASWQASEKAFQASVLELREQLAILHDHLSPETLVKVERALATIDLAIAEGREALLRDPANAALSELLASNYRQKIELLRRVTQLASS
jgi:hypothetical protein